MRHQIYTVIFMQGIHRTWNEQNHIVVACDEFMGAHNHLPVFGIFNYVHWSLSCGGGKSCTMVQHHRPKLVLSDIHDRGMGFGGAHVWKMSYPQAMEFFRTQKLGPMGGCPLPHYIFPNFFIIEALCAKKVCASSSEHALGSPFTW